MSVSITVVRPESREAQVVGTATTGLDLFGQDRTVVAMRVNGELRDLASELAANDVVEPVAIDSPDGLNILRHSTGHVTAQAVQTLYPDTKLGIGPFITDGYYYDFDTARPFTPEDVLAIEKQMGQIVRERQKFVRRVVSDDEAGAELVSEPYKLELIGIKGSAEGTEGATVEVGSGELTIYDNVRRDGSVAWKDLCRGPHVPHTGYLNAYALMRTSAAYWRGDQRNAQLQRVYGTSWPTRDDLKAYKFRLEEAAKRDHRKLGAELDLFSFPDEIGSGLPVFHPKGAIVRMEMEDYSRRRHVEEGYQFAYSPHLTKAALFETSGHLDWYADGMYPPMHLDEEVDADGNVRRQGQDYYMKPMNCPMHCLIYRNRGRSYRELPLRLFEFGTVYRYEKSGVVHGLTRARGFTQDDAHIYTTQEQVGPELARLLTFVLKLLADYGLDDFYLELSTRNPEKSIGDDETWEVATRTLQEVAERSGLDLVPDPGGAAFYGPKISVQARDAIGRTWQMSTIQLDFFEPERFELEYTAADGSRKRPVMIHRALFGSIERFFGVLTEHYAGAFPAWLAPVQVLGLPVAEEFNGYLSEVLERLKVNGVRVELDASDDRFGKKIRNASKSKAPFVLIAGETDASAGTVSFRYRDGTQRNGVPVGEAIELITGHIADRINSDPTAEGWSPVASEPVVESPGERPGDPDGFQRLWTPHRMVYIGGENKPSDSSAKQCPFCRAPQREDAEGLIVHRGVAAYVVVNLYPYSPGHLLICPYRHVSDYTDATPAEVAEIAGLTRRAMRVIRSVSHPAGFNLGINQGDVAGAGIAAHLHQHVVPRWPGDANFLPVVAQTRAVPQLLDDTRALLAEAWDA